MFYSALIGNPVEHSVSPALFKYLGECAKLEYGHIKINVPSVKALGSALKGLETLGFCGCNVTLPYKLSIIKLIDKISPEAKEIGAVNTIVFKEGEMAGYNTDAYGFLTAFESKLKKVTAKDRALILGAGGAARSIAYSLYRKTKNIIVLNRDLREAEIMSDDISSGKIIFKKLTDSNIKDCLRVCNIIVNATPVGMSPRKKDSLIGGQILESIDLSNKYFFDAIFNPYKTKFLENAERRGAKVCSGMYMMIFQAVKAFQLWTGVEPKRINIEKANNILRRALKD